MTCFSTPSVKASIFVAQDTSVSCFRNHAALQPPVLVVPAVAANLALPTGSNGPTAQTLSSAVLYVARVYLHSGRVEIMERAVLFPWKRNISLNGVLRRARHLT